MTAVNKYPEETVTKHHLHNNRKTLKAFEDSETDDGSSSEETETYSPKSVVLRTRKWPAAVKNNGDVFGRRVRNQIDRIRAEDLHLGEDIGEWLIVKICGAEDQDEVILTRPASPLSGKVSR